MISKEKIENKELFKNKYLQQPISLLTKRNLELLEQHCKRQLRHEVGQILREHEIVLELLDKYKQLETKQQKVKEKLGELKKEYKEALESNSTKAFILKCQIEILEEIIEGEE